MKRLARVTGAPMAGQAGMTLIEMILALAILSVALISLAGALPAATSYISQSGSDSTALFLAQQRLEQIRTSAWTSAPAADCLGVSNPAATAAPVTGSWANCSGAAPPGLVTYPDEAYGAIAGNAGFRRTVRVQNCAAGCAGVVHASLRQVTVTVFFRPTTASGSVDTGAEQSVQLVTFKAKRE